MALKKITEEEMNAQGVIAAPDILNGTPAQNKAIFDRMVRNLVAPAVNACAEAVDEVNANQEKWSKQEQTRETNEGERKTAEVRREEAEATRETNETARKQAEGNRSLAEGQRAAAEQARREAETVRQAKEQERNNAEQGRAADEATRRGSEAYRVEAENARNLNEAERQRVEALRVEVDSMRETAEVARQQAEQERKTAESGRNENEGKRQAQENARVEAERRRVDTDNGIVAQATAAAKRAEDSAKEVVQAAKPPYIGENGNWFVWDAEAAKFVDSGTGAQGDAGRTPERGTDYWTPADKKEIAEEAAKLVDVPEVVQKTGESESAVMSQKAVTDAIAAEHDAVPDYWLSALQNGVEAINKALCKAGANKSAFLFYTDAHWTFSAQKSPALLKYLYKHTGITKTFFGGDIVNNEADDYDTMAYLWEWRRRVKDLPNHHSVPGNHDDGNTTNHLFDKNYVYGYLLAAEETPSIVRGDGLYYYIDNPAEKTRYLYLDTACFGVDSKQEAFVKNALLTTPDGWHIVAVAHIWLNTDYTVSPPVPNGINADAAKLLTMFDAYNSRIGDYAKCKGWVEFCIGGHTHWDYDTTSNLGIPVILMETDSRDVRSGLGFTAGTTTEASVSGVIADYGAKKIKVVRVGRGESREVEMTWYEVPYVNQIPISTDASGAVYNGTGYKDGIRFGSDGADRTGAATDATGFIPCTPSDTLYFKDCQIAVLGSSSTSYQAIACYNSEKAFIKTRFVDMTTEMTGKDYDVDANGYLTRYNCADLWNGTAFVRISGNYIGADSIITVNEPIE